MSGLGQWVLHGIVVLGFGMVIFSIPHLTAMDRFASSSHANERANSVMHTMGSEQLNQKTSSKSVSTPYEMVLFEAPWCLYCLLFKEDVAPLYQQQKWSEKPKFSHVDFFSEGSAGYALKHSIQTLPTIVIFKKGREIGRVTGMTGAEEFFDLARHIIDQPS